MQTIIYAALRTIGAYLLLLLMTRLMGRKLVSQMTFFNFVIAIIIGTAAANVAIGQQNIIVTSTVAVIVLAVLGIASGYLHIKSFRARKVMNSEPVALIANGTIVEPNLKNVRLTLDELMMRLREKDVFSAADVEFALMETDGEVSVLVKPDKQPLTPSHMNIPAVSKGLERDIIIDGNIMTENLTAAGMTEQWLLEQLASHDISSASEVFYAGMDITKTLYISKRNSGVEKEGMYGIE